MSKYLDLLEGTISGVICYPDGHNQVLNPFTCEKFGCVNILSGSFNPWHEGHQAIWDAIKGTRFLELSIHRRNKEKLTHAEIVDRIAPLIKSGKTVLLTNSLKFSQKAGIFHESIINFHVGYDTAERILEDEGVLGVQGTHARFYVYPREVYGIVKDVFTFPVVPRNFLNGVLSDDSHIGVSSTEIRGELL